MGEPTQSIPFFDWLGRYIAIIIPAIMAVLGGLLAVSNRYKAGVEKQLTDQRAGIDHEIAKVWSEMRNHIAVQTTQGSHIAVLQVELKNTGLQLNDIKETTADTNRKVDGLGDKITAILLAVRKER